MTRAPWSSVVALGVAALVPPHLLAGAPTWTVPVIAAVCATSLAVVAWGTPVPRRAAPDLPLLGVWTYTCLQLVPLPAAFWGAVSPARLEAASTRALAGVDQSPLPLSMDPGRTLEQVVVGVGILGAYALARVFASRHGRRPVIAAVALSTVVVAVVGFAHELVGAHAVYGWHQPQETAPQLLSPLLNTNHFGGFSAFGAALCLGLVSTRRGREVDVRWAWLLASVVCGAAAIVSASRGAVLSLALGLGLASIARARSTRSRGERGRSTNQWWVGAAIVVTCTIALSAYLGLERIYRDFEEADYSKLEIARASLPLIAELPWLGAGRGAFASVFATIDPDGSAWTTTPENLLVVWTVEWGIVVTLVLIAAIGRTAWNAWRSRHVEVAIASGALIAFAVHDMVDFALEMPGLVVVVALLFGALASPRVRGEDAQHSRKPPEPETRRTSRWAAAAAAVVAMLLVLGLGPQVVARSPEALTSGLAEATAEPEVDGWAAEVARHHPLDPALSLQVAHAYERLGSRQALRWQNRAMQLAPAWATPHVGAARELLRIGANRQAMLEAREAERRQLGSARDLFCVLAPRLPDEVLLELAPPDLDRFLSTLARCVPERVAPLDAAALAQGHELASIHARIAQRAARGGDLMRARTHAERARVLAPDERATLLALASVVQRSEGPHAALDLLRNATPDHGLLRARARIAAEADDEPSLQADLARLRVLAAGRPRALASEWAFAAGLESARGNHGAALVAAERARELDPSSDAHLAAVARYSDRAGQSRRAERAHTELCRRGVEASCRALERRDVSRQRSPSREESPR